MGYFAVSCFPENDAESTWEAQRKKRRIAPAGPLFNDRQLSEPSAPFLDQTAARDDTR
jgi:hypothetical protein